MGRPGFQAQKPLWDHDILEVEILPLEGQVTFAREGAGSLAGTNSHGWSYRQDSNAEEGCLAETGTKKGL